MKKLLSLILVLYSAVSFAQEPTSANTNVSVNEDGTRVFNQGDFPYNDINGHPFTSVHLKSVASTGSLTLNGNPVGGTENIPVGDLPTLTYTPLPDENGTGYATFNFTVDDGVDGESTSTYTMTINVNAVNDLPSFTGGGNQTVQEDAGAQSVTGWATAISAGPADEPTGVTFIVSTTNPTLFSSSPQVASDGTLTYTPADDVNGTSDVSVMARDSEGATSAAQTFQIEVTPVNDPPEFDIIGNQTVNEDAGLQEVNNFIYNVSPGGGADEAGQTLTVTVSNNNGSLFQTEPSIDLITNKLTYQTALDQSGTANVTVYLSDGDKSSNKPFTITVNPVNDPPTSANSTVTTTENQVFTFSVGNFPYTDVENPTLDHITCTSVPTLGILWVDIDGDGSLNGAETQITAGNDVAQSDLANLKYKPEDNNNTTQSFNFTVSDGAASSSPDNTMTINITPVNSTPSFTAGSNLTINEDAGAQTVTGWAADINPGGADESSQNLTFIVNVTSGGTLFSTPPAIDATNGNLTYTPATNEYGTATVEVSLSDDGSPSQTSAAQTFQIDITPVNDPPSFTKGADHSCDEDAGAQSVNNWATSINKGATNESAQTLTFNVTADNTSLFSIQPAIDPATGTLTYTPAPDVYGNTTVTVNLSDDAGGISTPSETFTITINPVNDPPSFTAGGNVVCNEDAGTQTVNNWATGISKGAANESAQTLTFNVNVTSGASLFSVPPAIAPNGTLTYTPAPNKSGPANISVTLSDDAGGISTPTETFTITINEVNDPPTFTAGGNQKVYENDGSQTVTNWATDISPGEGEASQGYNFVVSNNNNSLFSVQPDVSNSGELTYTLAANQNGVATVSVYLEDLGSPAAQSATKTFTIEVVDVEFLTPADDITNAIANANDGDRIKLAGGTYNQNIDFAGKNIEILGDSVNPGNVIIQGTGTGSVVTFNNGETSNAVLRGVTIQNGTGTDANFGTTGAVAKYGGGIYCNGASPTLRNLIIQNNNLLKVGNTGASGGGIYLKNAGGAMLVDIEIRNNSTEVYRGGGIAIDESTVTLDNIYIHNNNTGNYGGGIAANASTLTIKDLTIEDNHANGLNGTGGGIFMLKCNHNIINPINVGSGNTSTKSGANLSTFGTPAISGVPNSLIIN